MSIPRQTCSRVQAPQRTRASHIPLFCSILVVLLEGCGAEFSQGHRGVAADGERGIAHQPEATACHASPEAAWTAFCQALRENHRDRLLYACDPGLRPAFGELLTWVDTMRRMKPELGEDEDVLKYWHTRFCKREEIVVERLCSDTGVVRNVLRGGRIALSRRGEAWFVSFDPDLGEAEYSMKLATELIKLRLNMRQPEDKHVQEGVGLSR